ncbi:hypothetical protein ABW20_dc0107205 [Dactylellina cionopaga]|nr:hypothetical protein ABW20_dc0107205 [Dactylellina cionopaga]
MADDASLNSERYDVKWGVKLRIDPESNGVLSVVIDPTSPADGNVDVVRTTKSYGLTEASMAQLITTYVKTNIGNALSNAIINVGKNLKGNGKFVYPATGYLNYSNLIFNNEGGLLAEVAYKAFPPDAPLVTLPSSKVDPAAPQPAVKRKTTVASSEIVILNHKLAWEPTTSVASVALTKDTVFTFKGKNATSDPILFRQVTIEFDSDAVEGREIFANAEFLLYNNIIPEPSEDKPSEDKPAEETPAEEGPAGEKPAGEKPIEEGALGTDTGAPDKDNADDKNNTITDEPTPSISEDTDGGNNTDPAETHLATSENIDPSENVLSTAESSSSSAAPDRRALVEKPNSVSVDNSGLVPVEHTDEPKPKPKPVPKPKVTSTVKLTESEDITNAKLSIASKSRGNKTSWVIKVSSTEDSILTIPPGGWVNVDIKGDTGVAGTYRVFIDEVWSDDQGNATDHWSEPVQVTLG